MKVKNDHRSKFSNLSFIRIPCDDHSLLSFKILNSKTTVARQSTKVKLNYIYNFLLDFEVKYECPSTRKSAQVR